MYQSHAAGTPVTIMPAASSPCPCGSGRDYRDCCEPCHAGTEPAVTAEALMRSRYSAFVLENSDYLLATWHASTRPGQVNFSSDQRWLGLKIRNTERGLNGDDSGVVEFVARYKIGGKGFRLHERSRFVFESDRWYYVDGDLL